MRQAEKPEGISRRRIAEKYPEVAELAAAVQVLKRVDAEMARKLRVLTGMKAGSHYGGTLLSTSDRDRAIKAAQDLVNSAKDRI